MEKHDPAPCVGGTLVPLGQCPLEWHCHPHPRPAEEGHRRCELENRMWVGGLDGLVEAYVLLCWISPVLPLTPLPTEPGRVPAWWVTASFLSAR